MDGTSALKNSAEKIDKDAIINQLIIRVESLENTVNDLKLKTVTQNKTPETESNGAADRTNIEKIKKERQENLSLIESAFKRTLVEEGGLLLRPGQFNYVPTISYTHSSSDRIVIDGFTVEDILVIGDIVSRQVRRDLILLNNTFRLGLKNDIQLDLQIPVGRERLQSFSSNGDEIKERTNGLGDISLSLGYQLVKSNSSWPDTLLNVSWKSTTGQDPFRLTSNDELSLGSGFESWSVSFTTVSVSDPVVFFSGLSYTANISENKAIGKVDSGDSLGIQLGMVFALNLDTSMSYGFQLSAVDETKINAIDIPGSNLLTSLFTIGVSRIFSDKTSMDLQIGIGLTRDSPDIQVSISFPYSVN